MTVMTGNNKTPLQIQTRLATRREGIAKRARVRKSKKPLGLDLTSVRPFLRGSTHNQARVERRGTKRYMFSLPFGAGPARSWRMDPRTMWGPYSIPSQN